MNGVERKKIEYNEGKDVGIFNLAIINLQVTSFVNR